MQIAKLILTLFSIATFAVAVSAQNVTRYSGGGGTGGYAAFVLSPQVAYGALSPTALVGAVGYMGAGRIDVIMSNFYGKTWKSPVLVKSAKKSANWVIGAGICNIEGVNCDTRRKLGLAVTDMISEELKGQGIISTFMMKGQYTHPNNEDLNDLSQAKFGRMSKAFLSKETFNRLKQYESLNNFKAPRERGLIYVENSGGSTVCNVCGVQGEILVEDGEQCIVREQCDASDDLPNPDGGIELPQVSLMTFNLDAACVEEDSETACLDEAALKETMLDTFGSTARVSVVEGNNFDLEDLYDSEDRKNLMNEEKRRLQSLDISEYSNTEECSLQSSYLVSVVFMDNNEFKAAKQELASETIEDDLATFLATDYANLCGIKVTPKFAYHIPAPNDPKFNKAVRPLEASMSIPTIQVASEDNGHESILERGETYQIIMDDFKTGETVTVHLVQVQEDSEEVRALKSVQNFDSTNGPIEFDWTIGDLQPVGSYYFEATIKDVPVSYSSAFEIIA